MDSPIVLFFVLSLAVFMWTFYLWPYRRYRVALLRQQLFNLRDELFEFARDNPDFRFDNPAYGITRSTINGMLRIAHQFNLCSVVAMSSTLRFASDEEKELVRKYEERREEAFNKLDEKTLTRVRSITFRANFQIASFILHTSLLLGIPFHLAKWTTKSLAVLGRLRDAILHSDIVNTCFRTFDAEAEIIGSESRSVEWHHNGRRAAKA